MRLDPQRLKNVIILQHPAWYYFPLRKKLLVAASPWWSLHETGTLIRPEPKSTRMETRDLDPKLRVVFPQSCVIVAELTRCFQDVEPLLHFR